jgi:hypothetical protein
MKNEMNSFGPVASGRWYSANPSSLRRTIQGYFDNVATVPVDHRIIAVISPHAGYQYSGQGAAFSFKPLMGRNIQRVVCLAPSHYRSFRGISVLKADKYLTPLGDITIDNEGAAAMQSNKLVLSREDAFSPEHSLENLLPFLQVALGNFELIPIIVGQIGEDDARILGEMLSQYIDERTVFSISSDFIHYGPGFGYLPFPVDEKTGDRITELDKGVIDKIVGIDPKGFSGYLKETGATICGANPILLLLHAIKGKARGQLLHYYKSADMTGDFESSVSYASIIFTLIYDGEDQ